MKLFYCFIFLLMALSTFAQVSAKLEDAKKRQASAPDSAFILFKQIYRESSVKNDLPSMSDALKGMGVCSYLSGNYNKALKYYQEALHIRLSKISPLNDSTNLSGIASVHHNIAITYIAMGDNTSAISEHLKGEKIRKQINDKIGLAKFTYQSMGGIFFSEGNYTQAIEYFFKALIIFINSHQLEGMAQTCENIGSVYFEQKDFARSLKHFRHSEKIRLKNKDTLGLSYTYNHLGLTYYALKRYEKAKDFFYKALRVKAKYNDIKGLAAVNNNLALVYQETSNMDSALQCAQRSFAYSQSINNLEGEIISQINLGSIFISLNDLSKAEINLHNAYEKANENNFSSLVHDAVDQLASLYSKKGDYKRAYYMRERQRALSDTLLNRENIKNIAIAETKFRFKNQMASDSIQNAETAARTEIEHKESLKRQSQIFWFTASIFILLLIILILFLRANKIRQKTKVEILKRKASEMENALLRSQMNPHFIFNSMNSIQSYISQNDSYSAERYLSKFAQLIRHILENSAQDFISLEEEINALKLYLDLEQARFKEKFIWTLEIDPLLDAEFTMVPPMILQPFVENAIIHGIMSKESKGSIDIRFSSSTIPSCIEAVIQDNGIGRKKAAENKTNIQGKKKSVGISISKERLKTIAIEDIGENGIKIEDLYDAWGNATGTKVILCIPCRIED